MGNLINAERVTMSYGTRTLLDSVSLGLDRGEVAGIVAGTEPVRRLCCGFWRGH